MKVDPADHCELDDSNAIGQNRLRAHDAVSAINMITCSKHLHHIYCSCVDCMQKLLPAASAWVLSTFLTDLCALSINVQMYCKLKVTSIAIASLHFHMQP